MIYKRMSWCLRQVKGNNVVVPVNLYSSSFDKTNQKQKDTQYCKKNGIIVLILPSEKIGESAQILWNRLKERDYYNPKYYTYMESFDKLKESIKYMLEISDIWVFDNNSPESASKKIITLLNQKGYLKNSILNCTEKLFTNPTHLKIKVNQAISVFSLQLNYQDLIKMNKLMFLIKSLKINSQRKISKR